MLKSCKNIHSSFNSPDLIFLYLDLKVHLAFRTLKIRKEKGYEEGCTFTFKVNNSQLQVFDNNLEIIIQGRFFRSMFLVHVTAVHNHTIRVKWVN